MNKCFLTGRICNDLEVRYTTNNKAVCQFTIAVNRPITRDGERIADFITCVVFGNQAENLQKYQTKGNLIGVEGSYRTDKYTDNQGNTRYKNYVLVNMIEFLESKKTTGNEPPTEATVESNPYADFGEQISLSQEIDDDMLPF